MTWKDLKVITLQKMFSISGDTITNDEATTVYTKSMPAAANEAMRRIATNCRGITRCAEIDCTEKDGYTVHDLSEIVENFYRLDENKMYMRENGRYSPVDEYDITDGHLLALPGGASYLIYCRVFPQTITSETPDDHVIELHPEEAAIIPLYMGAQLYKDDDMGHSVQMLNEFEVRLSELASLARSIDAQSHNSYGSRFKSKYGWW